MCTSNAMPFGTSAVVSADKFTYVLPPTVTGVSPSSGPATGGTTVTINGSRFAGATAVRFGTVSATSFTVVNNNRITAISPPQAAATVNITVTTAGGTSTTGPSSRFIYTPTGNLTINTADQQPTTTAMLAWWRPENDPLGVVASSGHRKLAGDMTA